MDRRIAMAEAKVPHEAVLLWGEKATAFRQQTCYSYIDSLLHGLRNMPPYRPSRIVLSDLGEKEGAWIVLLELYGNEAEFILLQGKIELTGFIESEYEYDIRYCYEAATDYLLEKGLATTVAEQKAIHYKAILADCEEKGLSFNEVCGNTLKFIEETG